MYVVGWTLYRAVIWRVVDRDLFISLLATFGLSILIQQLANQVFGANVETARSGLGTLALFGGSVTVAEIKLVAFVAAFVVAGAMVAFLKHAAPRTGDPRHRAERPRRPHSRRRHRPRLRHDLRPQRGDLRRRRRAGRDDLDHPALSRARLHRALLHDRGGGRARQPGRRDRRRRSALALPRHFAGFILGAEFQIAFVFALLVVDPGVPQLPAAPPAAISADASMSAHARRFPSPRSRPGDRRAACCCPTTASSWRCCGS